jgi:EAL domain-containing protein (putative c-di-GMP-specific phosphodiesterase class I)
VGIALGRGGETDVETLVHEADLAVYQAKASGRGHAELFSGAVRDELLRHSEIERALVVAIARDELVVHYQPIVHVGTGSIECYEALVRWNRPGVGLVMPDEFLPIAESSDLICDLDAWVLRTAAADLASWNRRRGDQALQVSVNISGRHISRPRILDDVAAAMRVSDILPPQLVIEVTETAMMDEQIATINLEALRHLGLVVSLDDFGTGYHSTGQLSRLPVDVLKIDRQYVAGSTPQERSLLELMVRTAHAFGARVVAEGIETIEQLELVEELGCEYAQGFLLGRPGPMGGLEHAERSRFAG